MSDAGLPRTTARGLLTDAEGLLAAAILLLQSGDSRVSQATYYLLGHAIEVALKSFLLSNGTSLATLRSKKFGHDIAQAAASVIAARSESISSLVEANFHHIERLNVYYSAKEFEYRVTGAKTYPSEHQLIAFLKELTIRLAPIVMAVFPKA